MRYNSRYSSRKLSSSRAFLCALGIATLGSLTTTAQAQTYTLTDLGTLGGSQSFATDVNNSGQVVGNSLTSDGSTHGFISGADGGPIKDLGTQITGISVYTGEPFTLTGTDSYAYGINNKGQVAGKISGGESANFGTTFVSTPNGGTLSMLPVFYLYHETVAIDINDKGQVAAGGDNAYLVNPDGTTVTLGSFGVSAL